MNSARGRLRPPEAQARAALAAAPLLGRSPSRGGVFQSWLGTAKKSFGIEVRYEQGAAVLAQPRERNGTGTRTERNATKILRKGGEADLQFTETTAMIFSRSGIFIGKWWYAWGTTRSEKSATRQPARACGVVFPCFARCLQTSSMILGSQVQQFLNGHRTPDRGPNDFCRPPKIHLGCPDFGWTKLDQTTNDSSQVPKNHFEAAALIRFRVEG